MSSISPIRSGPTRKAGTFSSKYWDELNAKAIKESGNRIIGWLDLGYRHVCNSKHPIRTIEDLKGLKSACPTTRS